MRTQVIPCYCGSSTNAGAVAGTRRLTSPVPGPNGRSRKSSFGIRSHTAVQGLSGHCRCPTTLQQPSAGTPHQAHAHGRESLAHGTYSSCTAPPRYNYLTCTADNAAASLRAAATPVAWSQLPFQRSSKNWSMVFSAATSDSEGVSETPSRACALSVGNCKAHHTVHPAPQSNSCSSCNICQRCAT
jgi:hypothetical protein